MTYRLTGEMDSAPVFSPLSQDISLFLNFCTSLTSSSCDDLYLGLFFLPPCSSNVFSSFFFSRLILMKPWDVHEIKSRFHNSLSSCFKYHKNPFNVPLTHRYYGNYSSKNGYSQQEDYMSFTLLLSGKQFIFLGSLKRKVISKCNPSRPVAKKNKKNKRLPNPSSAWTGPGWDGCAVTQCSG